MTPFDPDWKEKQEAEKELKRIRDAARKEQIENAEERLAMQEESQRVEKVEPAKEIPQVAKDYLKKLKGEI